MQRNYLQPEGNYTEKEKKFTHHISHKSLIYKNSQKSKQNKTKQPIKNCEGRAEHFTKKTLQIAKGTYAKKFIITNNISNVIKYYI